jgi:hypothetical protein
MVCRSFPAAFRLAATDQIPQVLFKRKPVQLLPVPEIEDEGQEVRTSASPPPIDCS